MVSILPRWSGGEQGPIGRRAEAAWWQRPVARKASRNAFAVGPVDCYIFGWSQAVECERAGVRNIAAFLALTTRDKALLVQAFATLALVWVELRLMSIDRLRARSGRIGAGGLSVGQIVWAVRAAARRVPGATCLCSALALQRLLSANGHVSDLRIGVARHGDRFAAHAWVVGDGQVLIGEQEHGGFTELAAWRAGDVT